MVRMNNIKTMFGINKTIEPVTVSNMQTAGILAVHFGIINKKTMNYTLDIFEYITYYISMYYMNHLIYINQFLFVQQYQGLICHVEK